MDLRRPSWSAFCGVDARYQVCIRARPTENRNSRSACFVVDGEARRISQHDLRGRKLTTVWGTRRLSGDELVRLDSAQEGESDSVIWGRLVPVGP